MIQTDIVIVGGGPAGLMLAIELGCRGVNCVVLEEDAQDPQFPKANATSSRTMEHYRRRGFADRVRSLGLTSEHPQDIVYCTRLASTELTRFRIPSRAQAVLRSSFGDYGEESWPTPELPHRGQQMYIEPVLREQAESYPSVSVRLGWRATEVHLEGSHARVIVADTLTSDRLELRCRYVVGCDGPRSLVRKTCGISYVGRSNEDRDFFGGQMLSVYFRSSDLYGVIGKEKAWQYWAVNGEQRALLVAIDGVDRFLLCIQLKAGQLPEAVDYRQAGLLAVGAPFEMNVIGVAPWLAGYTLVAERFSNSRAFIAGDAAHLFTPSGGMGYNTSIDDVVNLGWKLSAVIQGWAPEELLRSYEEERKPIAERNTAFARTMADSIGHVPLGPDLEKATPEGERARRALGDALSIHVRKEFNIPGLQLGLNYHGSSIVADTATPSPPDDANHYVPSGIPGSRAPHIWLDGNSIFDLFGRDFTFLCFDEGSVDEWHRAAKDLGLPLTVLRCADRQARSLYGADCALIRPDHHVAWRGPASASARGVLARAIGGVEHEVRVNA